jgi:hypothetical protein
MIRFWKREIRRRGFFGNGKSAGEGVRGQIHCMPACAGRRGRGVGWRRGVEAWNCPWPLDGGEAFSDKIWVVGFHMKIFLGA